MEEMPKLLIHSNNIFNPLSYQFSDGSPVTSSEFKQLLDIPTNQTLLKQIKQTTIASKSLGFFTLAIAGGMFAYIFGDLPNSEIMLPVLSGVSILSSTSIIFISQITGIKIMQAVDNYNLYILGIPIGNMRK
jgi:hypothetical protein